METLTNHVVEQTALQQHSSLSLGSLGLPVPPANVDPADYSKWFNEKTAADDGQINVAKLLALDISVEREYNEAWYEYS